MFSVLRWHWRCLKYLIPGADYSSSTRIIHETPSTPPNCRFNRLPPNVMGNILGKLPIGDRVRMRLVCKSWRDTLLRADLPLQPEPPWLILPNYTYFFLECFLRPQIWFESISEDRLYRFLFPGSVVPRRWWCCGSSSTTGWLLMAGRNSLTKGVTMMLWDPISGATRKLPALSTLPFFRELHGDCICARAHVFSVSGRSVVAAVVFVTGGNQRRLALCSPQDQRWSVVQGEEGRAVGYHEDILFHNGKLYTVCIAAQRQKARSLSSVSSDNQTIRLSCCDVEVIMLWLVYEEEKDGDRRYPIGYSVRERWKVVEHLVGSRDQLLVVSAVLDLCLYKDSSGGQGPIPSYACSQTRGFEVSRIDVINGGLCCLERLTNIGEQCIYLGANGSTSIDRVDEAPNCIQFATDDARRTIGIGDEVKFNPEKSYAVHERSVFDVAQDKIDTISFTSLKDRCSGSYTAGWFTPKLPPGTIIS